MRSHEWIDQRSLAFDRAIAAKLQVDPSLLERARATLKRWLNQRQPTPPQVLLEWQQILETWPADQILQLLVDSSQHARRLRQSSPFCGILSSEERLGILKDYESRRA